MDRPVRERSRTPYKQQAEHVKKTQKSVNKCLKCSKSRPVFLDHHCKCKTGILNSGNSCYINCVLQALAELSIPLDLPQDSTFVEVYKKLNEYSREPLCISPFLTELSDIWIHRDHQEDAHEFFTAMLSICDSSRFSFTIRTRVVCTVCEAVNLDYYKEDNTFHMIMDGSSLQEQVKESAEYIEMECPNCFISVHSIFKSIAVPPDIFVVKMNRFQFNLKTGKVAKIRTKMNLPQALDMDGVQLQLNTVILHKGKAVTHGHYVTYIHAKEIEIDDDKVLYGQRFNLDYSYFYIAFYTRQMAPVLNNTDQ